MANVCGWTVARTNQGTERSSTVQDIQDIKDIQDIQLCITVDGLKDSVWEQVNLL